MSLRFVAVVVGSSVVAVVVVAVVVFVVVAKVGQLASAEQLLRTLGRLSSLQLSPAPLESVLFPTTSFFQTQRKDLVWWPPGPQLTEHCVQKINEKKKPTNYLLTF